MNPSKHQVHVVAGLLALLVVITACGTDSQPSDQGVLVVATTSIFGDIASNVVGGEGTVEFLIPLGGDSHDFSPSAQQAARLIEADLVVAGGLNLEEGMADVLESADTNGARVIELALMVDPIPFTGPEHEEEAGHEGEDEADQGIEDPHFWMDPIRVGEAAIALAGSLEETNPGGGWLARAEAYAEQMGATDTAIRSLLEDVPEASRKMVTNHEAFGYFAARYDFELVGVVIPGGSSLAEPSSAELAELVAVMEREDIRVIFAETSRPATLAEAVAAELGDEVEVVELFTESLGPPGSGAEGLSEMLIANAESIAAALE